jgi:hypothetical protein
MLCEQTFIKFKTDASVKEEATKLRGYIAQHYRDIPHFHHHTGKKFDYNHPLIQYRIIDGSPLIVGLRQGSILLQLMDSFSELKLGNNTYRILETKSETIPTEIGSTCKLISYSFLTPWLALNEKNYEKYQMLGSWGKKKELLEKILIGNIISMSKSLGYTVPAPIEANIHHLKEVKTSLKGTPMLGFLGNFSVNFEIPDYWGIGKSVSRGFGTLIRMKSEK